MRWLIGPLVKIADDLDPFDYRRPATIIAKLQDTINASFEQQLQEQGPKSFLEFLQVAAGARR